MATYKSEVLHQAYRRPAAAARRTTRWAGCPAGRGCAGRAAAAGQRRRWPGRPAAPAGALAPASTSAGDLPRVRPATLPAAGSPATAARPTGDAGAAVGRHVHRPLRPGGRRRRRAGARARPATTVQLAGRAAVLRPDLDHHRPARRRARILRRTRRRARPGTSTPGVPVVGLEPSCTAVLRGDAAELLRRPRRGRGRGRDRTLAELLAATPGWTPPTLAGVDGGRPAALPPPRRDGLVGRRGLLARAGADGHRRRRLLRPGRQLRRRARPLRRLRGRGRAAAAARGARTPPRRGRARRRLLLPHPARPAHRPPRRSTWPSCWTARTGDQPPQTAPVGSGPPGAAQQWPHSPRWWLLAWRSAALNSGRSR